MRVRRRPKSRKVRHSLGRNLSRSLKSTSPIKNNHGAAAAHNSGISHEKRRSSKKLRRLMRKKGMKRNTSKLLEVYSTLDSRNSAVKKKRGLSKGLAQSDAKDLILKLLGDKSTFTVCCYDEEASQLQDMDLMILGSSPDEYKRYTQLLRLEYECMNDFDYKQMRLKVLQTLLMIPTIFACSEYQTKYEEQARTNIKQEIELLKQ